MPGVKWIRPPEVNHLAALFRAYRKATGLTSREIGKAVGCSPENARHQMNKPGREWQVGMLLKYCDVLGIPYKDALEAAAKK